MHKPSILAVVAFSLVLACPALRSSAAGDESAGQAAIQQAIAQLEARKATATTKAAQGKINEAITALTKLRDAGQGAEVRIGTSPVKQVTAHDLETFGQDLVGKQCEMPCKFISIDYTWIRLLSMGDNFVGLFVQDRRTDPFQCAFVNKTKHARLLQSLSSGTALRLVGTVAKVKNKYVLLVDEIEVLK
jgi:hypothetical protein